MTEPAPETRRDVHRCVTVANRLGVVEPLRGCAVAILADVVPLAMAARQVVLEKDEIALVEAFLGRERLAGSGQAADVLVPHDQRAAPQRQAVLADVGPTDASDLDLQQRRIVGNRREIQLPQFGGRWSYLYRGQHLFCQSSLRNVPIAV